MDSTENSQLEFIMCEQHPYKKAKKYCSAQDCRKFLCNACCLEDHSKHLDSLQNIQKYYKKELESLENFSNNSDADISKISSSFVFKCLVNVFHEAKNYCLECKNFICVKCSSGHEKTHPLVSNEDLFESLNEKLKIIKNAVNKEMFLIKVLEEEKNLIAISKEANLILEDKNLKNAFALKFNFESFFKMLKKLKLMIIGKLSKIFAEKHSCLFAKKVDLAKFASFLDSYRFEKDKNKFFASFIKNESLINSIIKDNEVLEINQFINLNNKLRDLYESTVRKCSETLSGFSLDADNLYKSYSQQLEHIRNCFVQGFEDVVNKENSALDKNEFLNVLYAKADEMVFISDDGVRLENVYTAACDENANDSNFSDNKNIAKNTFNNTPREIIKYVTKEVYIEKDRDLLEKEFREKLCKEFHTKVAAVKVENMSFDSAALNLNENSNPNLQNKITVIKRDIQEVEVIKYQKPTYFISSDLEAKQANEFTFSKTEKKKNLSDNKLRIVKFEEPKDASTEFNLEGGIIERDLVKVNKKIEVDNTSNKSFSEGEAGNENDENVSKLGNLKSKISSRRRRYTNSSKSSVKSFEEEILIENGEQQQEPENNKTNSLEKQDIASINSRNNKEQNSIRNSNDNYNKSINNKNNGSNSNEIIDSNSQLNPIFISDINNKNNENDYDGDNNINNTNNICNKNETEKIVIPDTDALSEPLPTESHVSDSNRTSNASVGSHKSAKDSPAKSNFHDILSFGFNCKSCFAFNPSESKITEIENTLFKFPAFHSFINIPPYAFIGGGKDSQGKELNSFSKFQRTEAKKIELVELQKMNLPRHHHLYVYYRQMHQILCIGGSKIKACEVYDISSDSWAVLGELNVSRECPSACVTDQNTLFVFFGFDKNVNKYVNSIEKLDLAGTENGAKSKFEVLNVKGNQNILKKHSAAALQIEPGKVLIFGGINSLRNTSKDVLVYDLNANTGQFFSCSLPVNASFHNCGFVDLSIENEIQEAEAESSLNKANNGNIGCSVGKVLYNFTDDFKIIKLNTENYSTEIIEY